MARDKARLGLLCEEYVELTHKIAALEARRDEIHDVIEKHLPAPYYARVLCGSGLSLSVLLVDQDDGGLTLDVSAAVTSYGLDWPAELSVADFDEEAA